MIIHVRMIERTTHLKTAIDSKAIDIIFIPLVRIASYREQFLIGHIPLTRCLCFIEHIIRTIVQKVHQIVRHIPFAKEFASDAIHSKRWKNLSTQLHAEANTHYQ